MRANTLDQNEKGQSDGLALDRVFTGKASGRKTSGLQLTELLRFARDGDTVVVHRLDRLAGLSTTSASSCRPSPQGRRVEFVKESLVLTGEDSLANVMLSVVGALAEFGRALIREPQRQGIVLSKQGPQRAEEDAYS